jgi:hypothetical protein
MVKTNATFKLSKTSKKMIASEPDAVKRGLLKKMFIEADYVWQQPRRSFKPREGTSTQDTKNNDTSN